MSTCGRGFLLHIGIPKTGTATIQRALFANHPEIYLLGKHMPSKFPEGCVSREVFHLLRPLLWQLWRPFNIEKRKTMLESIILHDIGADRYLAGSWEELGNSYLKRHVKRLNRLISVFGDFRLMVTIRNPLTRICSEYIQHLRGHFIYANRPWMGRMPYLEIDEWLRRKAKKMHSLEQALSYSQHIQIGAELLGRNNVGVFLFEEMLEDPEKYYRNICEFMGIDVNKGLELTREKHLNRSLSRGQIAFLQQLNESSIREKIVLRLKGSDFRRKLLQSNSGDGVAAKITLPDHLVGEISDVTRAGNQWLVDTYNLPLSQYGYPL
jgi:hypothetical protein